MAGSLCPAIYLYPPTLIYESCQSRFRKRAGLRVYNVGRSELAKSDMSCSMCLIMSDIAMLSPTYRFRFLCVLRDSDNEHVGHRDAQSDLRSDSRNNLYFNLIRIGIATRHALKRQLSCNRTPTIHTDTRRCCQISHR